jgi:predicted ATPase
MDYPVHEHRTPLVGRDSDRAAILACLKRLLAGQGGFLSIVGEAGMGKSRLVADVTRLLPNAPLYRLEGRAFAMTESISYAPFREILRTYANIAESDPPAAGWAKLSQRVGALFPGECDQVLPYLALLGAVEPADEFAGRPRALDSESMRQQVFRAVRCFFERLAQQQPVWLVWEDWHWADAASEELAAHLLPLVESVPLLLCCLGRPDPDSPMVRFPQLAARRLPLRSTWIRLGPLSSTHSAELLHALSPTVDALLDGRILQLTGGNPFFIEEVVRAVREQKISSTRPAEVQIPSSVQQVILNRVVPLGAELCAVLQVAAVLGPSFSERMLQGVLGYGPSLDRHLETLQQWALLREERGPAEVGYAFQHALTQQAIYQAIPAAWRRALHRQVGEWLETTFAAQEQEVYGLLAYHYTCAEAWEQAQRYLLAAGDQAGRLAADAKALGHYERALAAYGRGFGERWDPLERAVLERKVGEARNRRGEHPPAKEYPYPTLSLLRMPLPTSRWGVRVALAYELARQIGHRLLPRRLPHP